MRLMPGGWMPPWKCLEQDVPSGPLFPSTSSPFVPSSTYIRFTAFIFVPETKIANAVTGKVRAKEFRNMRKVYTSV